MSEYRFYRSATNQDYLRHVIEPLLVEREMDTRFAPAVAALMETWGWSHEEAIACIRAATR